MEGRRVGGREGEKGMKVDRGRGRDGWREEGREGGTEIGRSREREELERLTPLITVATSSRHIISARSVALRPV